MVVIALILALGDLVTWLFVGLACGVRENGPRVTALCIENDTTDKSYIPLAGAAVVLCAAVLAHRARQPWIFAVGALAALVAGLYVVFVLGF